MYLVLLGWFDGMVLFVKDVDFLFGVRIFINIIVFVFKDVGFIMEEVVIFLGNLFFYVKFGFCDV